MQTAWSPYAAGPQLAAQRLWHLCFLGAMNVRAQGWQREGPWIFSQ